jgi:hypothetical protein
MLVADLQLLAEYKCPVLARDKARTAPIPALQAATAAASPTLKVSRAPSRADDPRLHLQINYSVQGH